MNEIPDSLAIDGQRPGIGLTGFVQAPSGGVPAPLSEDQSMVLKRIADTFRGGRFAVLTGAGLSTDSGIPDYRGPNAVPRKPLTYQEFVGDAALRQRYWARNHVGWRFLRHADPNAGHLAVAARTASPRGCAPSTVGAGRHHPQIPGM